MGMGMGMGRDSQVEWVIKEGSSAHKVKELWTGGSC